MLNDGDEAGWAFVILGVLLLLALLPYTVWENPAGAGERFKTLLICIVIGGLYVTWRVGSAALIALGVVIAILTLKVLDWG